MRSNWSRIFNFIILLGWFFICVTACRSKNDRTRVPIPLITQFEITSTPTVRGLIPTPEVTLINKQILSPRMNELLNELNGYTGESEYIFVEMIECPGLHPGYRDTGELRSLINRSKQLLMQLDQGDYYFQFDCTQKHYRVVIADKQPDAICNCQP